jgi:hypothetical protein
MMSDESRPFIPDHKLIRPIGSGSYGVVWLARSVLGVYRAIKIVSRKRFDHARPFKREYEGIKRFEPISRVHDAFVDILRVGAGHEGEDPGVPLLDRVTVPRIHGHP